MTEHTLGPWKAQPDTQVHCNNRHWITGISRIDGRRAHVAADVVNHNVALICSAPEMLDALMRVTADFDSQNFTVSLETIDVVRSVISKAEGKRS
jgi:hypothetical protein